MLLSEYLRTYALQHDLQPGTRVQLEMVVKQFEKFTSNTPLADITSEQINRWCDSLMGRNKRVTVHSKIRRLRTLLKAAARAHLRKRLDGPVRRLKVPPHVVRAFTQADVQKLLAAASREKGWYRLTGIRRRDFWMAYIHAAWDTCFRAGDMLSVRYSHLREETRTCVKVQRKSGRQVVGKLREETWQAIERIRRQGDDEEEDRYIFPWLARREAFYKAFRELAAEAGVKGTSKYLRRARATDECKRRGPAAAARILGHADGTGALALRNYVDKSLVADDLPEPPPIMPEPSVVNGHPAFNGHL